MKSTVAFVMTVLLFSACGEDDVSGPSENGPPTVASVVVTPSVNTFISTGASVKLIATAMDASGVVVSGKSFAWATSGASVVTITSSGLATAVGDGSATVTATTDGVSSNPANVSVRHIDDLVAEYRFSGNAQDTKGVNHGIIEGGTTLIEDRFGTENSAYRFDGIDARIVTTQDQFANGDDLSVSFWVRGVASGPTQFFIMSSDFAAAFSDNNVAMVISTPRTSAAPGPLPPNVWTHVVGTYDGTNIKIFLNGVLTSTTRWPGNISDPDRPLTFGFFNATFWSGDLDDVRIYSRAITDQVEVDALFEEGSYSPQ